MWALGVLLYALLAGSFPFRGQNEKELYGKISRGQFKYPETMTRDAKYVIQRMVEVDARKRYRASDMMRESWIKCNDLPLSIFETAGTLFRANSVDGRSSLSFNNPRDSAIHGPRANSKADGFNRNISKLHT
jgi:serine/threonine protein kinase